MEIIKNGISIYTVAEYLIRKFNDENKNITQLKLQKLLFLIEAYYMARYDKKRLYKEEFLKWEYGPVCKEIYDKYCRFLNLPIKVNSDIDYHFSAEVLSSINTIYDVFGNLSSYQLVVLAHRKGSSWYQTSSNDVISKDLTKKWFREMFLDEEE